VTREEFSKVQYGDILWVKLPKRWDQLIVQRVDHESGWAEGRYQDFSNPGNPVFGTGKVSYDYLHWKADKSMVEGLTY
jgi:hypothetical protein